MTKAPPRNDDDIQEHLSRVFRENVRALRGDLGISQTELARRLGRSPGYVCDVERGRRRPNVGTAALFAEALGCAAAVLFGDTPVK